jgi:hypothetical protein
VTSVPYKIAAVQIAPVFLSREGTVVRLSVMREAKAVAKVIQRPARRPAEALKGTPTGPRAKRK